MKLTSFVLATAFTVALPAWGIGQESSPGASIQVKIAVINIDRVAAESNAGKELFDRLKEENDKLAVERARREQEIRELSSKLTSEVLSADAQGRLQREIERKRTEAQRWLEDAQAEFQEKQQEEEAAFQAKLGPIVEAVAREQGIGLILRDTPGLTFVLDAQLDLTPAVVQRLNESGSAASPAAAPAAPAGEPAAETPPPTTTPPPQN
ncbi:MAG TPA: OmpH family outer membrane protein [Vicinamibacteria bacterium]